VHSLGAQAVLTKAGDHNEDAAVRGRSMSATHLTAARKRTSPKDNFGPDAGIGQSSAIGSPAEQDWLWLKFQSWHARK
jgi:hypothetical protein